MNGNQIKLMANFWKEIVMEHCQNSPIIGPGKHEPELVLFGDSGRWQHNKETNTNNTTITEDASWGNIKKEGEIFDERVTGKKKITKEEINFKKIGRLREEKSQF